MKLRLGLILNFFPCTLDKLDQQNEFLQDIIPLDDRYLSFE